MTRRTPPLVLIVLAIATVLLVLLLARAGAGGRAGALPDDLEVALASMDPAEMAVQAEGYMATDRPWRAARVMRSYVERTGDPSKERRVLAARAEAGWGGWPEVLALLDGVDDLDTQSDGIGLYLRGRARDEAGDAAGAAGDYTAFLAAAPAGGDLEAEREAARLRLGLALLRIGRGDEAGEHLGLARRQAGGAGIWLELLEADALAATGDTARVRAAVAGHTDGVRGLRAWRARIRAARAAGDAAAARSLANQARAWAQTSGTRAEFLVSAALAAIEMGDLEAGRAALHSAIELSGGGAPAREAAEQLRAGEMTTADRLVVARVYAAQGLHEPAIPLYREWLESPRRATAQEAEVRLELGSSLYWAERYGEIEPVLRPIASRTDAQLQIARAEARQGDNAAAARRYLSVAERVGGVSTLFTAASTWHDAGDLDRAQELYRRVITRQPAGAQAGLARMRLAGIAFLEGDHAEAARLWDQYRRQFPRGDLAVQSTYWAGRARSEMGDSAGAAALFREVRQRSRDSYYALAASQRLGVPFWPLPMTDSPGESPAAAERVAGWMRGIDLLRTAGFDDEASAEADRVVATAGADRATRYALAEALAERGYSQRAIRIGLALQGSGPPDRRLLRILYPFPYRTLISEEARDRGLDPFVTAALIRQESMFEQRITSHVGARGLMQIMPATGQRLADGAGLDRWDDELLYHPEINVHLGTRYVAQHWQSYDGSLPAVFGSYNAGAHRVEWWRTFPEFGRDDELFTERIPFRETRDYVKILTRNRAIYEGLYGGAD